MESGTFKLPESVHLNTQQVVVKQVGPALVLIPVENSWQSLFDSLDQFSEDFMEQREQPKPQVRECLSSLTHLSNTAR